MKFFYRKIRIFFDVENWLWKSEFCHFLTTFAQLSARLKNFLGGWLLVLVLGLEEGECATLCVKSWVILQTVFRGVKNFVLVKRGNLFQFFLLCGCFSRFYRGFWCLSQKFRENESLKIFIASSGDMLVNIPYKIATNNDHLLITLRCLIYGDHPFINFRKDSTLPFFFM